MLTHFPFVASPWWVVSRRSWNLDVELCLNNLKVQIPSFSTMEISIFEVSFLFFFLFW